MISYKPFWETLNKRDMSTYDLIYHQGLSANTIHRIRHNKPITTSTIDELCSILNCSVADIILYEEESE